MQGGEEGGIGKGQNGEEGAKREDGGRGEKGHQ